MPSDSESFGPLEAHLVTSMRELFEAYEIKVTHTGTGSEPFAGQPSQALVAAIIGYAGRAVRGALVLLAAVDTVKTWQPGLGPDASRDAVRDTVGEFSNMLLGRVKNRLLHHDVVLLLSTPTTAFGTDLALPPPSGGASSWLCFESPAGKIHVRIDAAFQPGFRLGEERERPGGGPPSASEGDVMLF